MNRKTTMLRTLQTMRGTTMTLSLAVMLAASLLLLVPAQPARAQQPSPQGTPDANCSRPLESYINATTSQRMAQTFTAQNSGKLTSAQLVVSKSPDSSGDYVLSIHAVDASGVPANTVLASTMVPDSTVPAHGATITGDFADPARVEAGQEYALVVERPGSDELKLGNRNRDACPGQPYISSSETEAFVELYGGQADIIFATFVTVNEPPLAKNDAYKAKKNKTLSVGQPGVLANDSDPDGDALTARLVSGPRKGKLALEADGSFTYKPKKNFRGTDSFVYEVSDGSGGTDQAKVTISVGKTRL